MSTKSIRWEVLSLYLQGRQAHWRRRWQSIRKESAIEVAQIILGGFSFVIGMLMMVLRHGTGGSPVVVATDEAFAKSDAFADHLLRHPHFLPLEWIANIFPHQVLGAVLVLAGASLLIAVMEWPVKGDYEKGGSWVEAAYSPRRLHRLLLMHLGGHFVSLNFWGGFGCLMFINQPGMYIPAAGCAFFGIVHYLLFRMNWVEYEKTVGVAARAQAKQKRLKSKAELPPTERVFLTEVRPRN